VPSVGEATARPVGKRLASASGGEQAEWALGNASQQKRRGDSQAADQERPSQSKSINDCARRHGGEHVDQRPRAQDRSHGASAQTQIFTDLVDQGRHNANGKTERHVHAA